MNLSTNTDRKIYSADDRMVIIIQKTPTGKGTKPPKMKLTPNYKDFLKVSHDTQGQRIILGYYDETINKKTKKPYKETFIKKEAYDLLPKSIQNIYRPFFQYEFIFPGTGTYFDPDCKAIFQGNNIYFYLNNLKKQPTKSRFQLIQQYIQQLFIDKPVFHQRATVNKPGSVWTHVTRKAHVKEYEILNVWMDGSIGKPVLQYMKEKKYDVLRPGYPTSCYLQISKTGNEVYIYNKTAQQEKRSTNKYSDEYKIEIKLRKLNNIKINQFKLYPDIQQMFYKKLYRLLYLKVINRLSKPIRKLFRDELDIKKANQPTEVRQITEKLLSPEIISDNFITIPEIINN